MLQILTKRLSLSEYAKRPNERKDIYAYIHTLVKTIKELVSRGSNVASMQESKAVQTMNAIVRSGQTFWDALEVATQQDFAMSRKTVEWGTLTYQAVAN